MVPLEATRSKVAKAQLSTVWSSIQESPDPYMETSHLRFSKFRSVGKIQDVNWIFAVCKCHRSDTRATTYYSQLFFSDLSGEHHGNRSDLHVNTGLPLK